MYGIFLELVKKYKILYILVFRINVSLLIGIVLYRILL